MRTVPTLLAAAVIAVGSAVLTVPVAHAMPWDCENNITNTNQAPACRQELQQAFEDCNHNYEATEAQNTACKEKVLARERTLARSLEVIECKMNPDILENGVCPGG